MMISSSSTKRSLPLPASAPKDLIRLPVKVLVVIVLLLCAHGMAVFSLSWKKVEELSFESPVNSSRSRSSGGGGGLTTNNISTSSHHHQEEEEVVVVRHQQTLLERERLQLTGVPTTDPKTSTDSFGIRAYYEALPQVIKDRLKKTAIVVTYMGLRTECETARMKHLVETTPGMDIWISHAHSKLDEETRNISLSNIRSLPVNVQLVEQSSTRFWPFDDHMSGSSKSSFLRFVTQQTEKYDFVWHIESDVWYQGPWIELFQGEAQDHVTDLVTISLSQQTIKSWPLLKRYRCRVPAGKCPDIAPLKMGWMMNRVSKQYANRMLPELEKGTIYGHCEAVTAQFALSNNMTIRAMDPTKVGVNRFGTPVSPSKIRNFRTASLIHPIKCKKYDAGLHNIHTDLAESSYRVPITNQDRDEMIWGNATTGRRKLHIYRIVGSNMTKRSMDSWGLKESCTTFAEVPWIEDVEISEMIANGTLSFWNETELELANLRNFTRVNDDNKNELLSFLSETLAFVMAIQQAYTAGHDTVLIVPNTTSFIPRLFAAEWANQLDFLTEKKGPKWNMFLWQSNPVFPLLHRNGGEKIKPWDWTHGSRGDPFTISRRGMEVFLSQLQQGENAFWKIPLIRGPLYALLTSPSVYVSAEARWFFDAAAVDRWPSIVSPEFLS